MNQYIIKKLAAPIVLLNATKSDIDWQAISALTIDTFPWYDAGTKQSTQVKLTSNNDCLFIQIIAQDKYSFAKQTTLNHMLICDDSCVEFFFSPSGKLGSSYINLEVNCCGTMHLAYGAGRENRQFIDLEVASSIQRVCSITSPVKIETNHDKQWTIEIALPFSALEKFTGEKVNRSQWYGNFYRCGGRIEPQYAVWNNIDVLEPDYHRPESFGSLIFNTE